ncbi:hypothetical protein CRYO30217_03249 [Parvicella tangerina]|uniref:Secretion system C-terminal sorting domain-containing protein n=2 Tax=Parvicella tangerina TaxID=2829795 RepID=A0A916NJZ7_9FLAO|nr:hypothetical protein CRYO30217_03249 [Parvicella tangerina]
MVFSFYGQYLNQVNETEDKMELTYCYDFNESLGSLFSVSTTLKDTNVTGTGVNFLEFKRYDGNHNVILNKQYGDTTHRYTNFYGMEFFKGNYYSCGVKRRVANPDTLFGYVMKWDTLGNVIWGKEYYFNNEDVRIGYMSSTDSSIYFACNKSNFSTSSDIETILTEIDTAGTVLWDTIISGYDQQPNSIRTTNDKGLILSTNSNYQIGARNPIIYKLDSLHNIEWSKVLGPNDRDHALQFFELPSGNFLGVGSSEEPSTGYSRAWLVELDKNDGQVLKDTVYWFAPRSSTFNGFSNLIFRNNEIILNASKSASSLLSGQPYHALLVSLSYDYEINWVREYAHRESANGFYHIYENNDFYYLQGLVWQDDPSNTHDEWFLVVDSLGCDDVWCTVGVEEVQHENSCKMTIYPNPSNGEFWIKPNEQIQKGEIIITDLTGKQIAKVSVNNTTNVSLSNMSEGVYLINLASENTIIDTQKIVIQR